ncbi:MAG: anthranilate synthase component I family protein [Acidobacteriota bacterium]
MHTPPIRAFRPSRTIFHKSILADLLTPVSAFLRVAQGAERAFLLESVEGGEKIGRFSFIGANPFQTFQGGLAEFRESFPPVEKAPSGLPPFTGGGVGLFSYDMVRELERLPDLKKRGPGAEASVLMDFYSTLLAFDHLKHQIIILSHDGMGEVEQLEKRLSGPVSSLERASLPLEGARWRDTDSDLVVQSNFPKEAFCEAVETAKEYIAAGDIFQVVLSQQFEAEFKGDPFDVYRALRFVNPSPYLFFLKLGETSIVGSSPEMLLRVHGRELHYRPIAGTRRRGQTAEEEKELESELLRDEKERAEHIMLVDLGRNDLGRVSEYGTVRVEALMLLEKYSHVMHLVSALKSRLRSDLDRFDALAACFPAGTVTGAPKVRAMEIIEQLEPSRRGVYAGAIGYLDFSGNLDTCIAIRTIVLRDGRARLQAGAGIVADSVPPLEYQECYNKAHALIQALELARKLSPK